MAGNIEEEVLRTKVELDGKQATSIVDKLTKQIRDLSKLAREVKLGGSKEDLKTIQDQIKNLDSLRNHFVNITATAGKGVASIKNITDSFKHLSDVLVPIRGRLKEINREMASIRTAYSGINTLYNKAMYQGRRDFLLYGTQEGQTFNENKLKAEQDKIIRKNWESSNPVAAQAAKNQEALNKAIYRATNILPTYQLYIMANYAAINKLIGGYKYLLNYTVQYDEELHQLQAISGTTTGTLKQMQKSIEDVAATTEFTSLELAKASTILAQAGLSATQIEGTLPAIAKLATATGTDLNTSVETITSTLNIYNLQTSEAEHVTNALTTAMNESKANIAGFQQAIQYAGSLASQLGISFDETAAAISAAAQAGIRSRTMIGTGMRAALTELLKPTKKFTEQLESVGLTLDDIDVKTKGYVNVLKTLKEAGFGAEEAFKGLNKRAATFLVTQINQVDFMQNLRQEMASSTAASKANEVQMESLAKQYKTFQNNIANAATRGLEPFISLLSKLLKVLNQLFNTPVIKQALGVLLTGVSVGGGLKTLQIMFKSFGSFMKALPTVSTIKELSSFFAIAKTVGPSWATLAASFKLMFTSIPGLTVITMLASGIYQLGDAYGWWKTNLEKVNEEMEKAKGELEEAKNKTAGIQEVLQRVYDQREKLQDQTERNIFVQEIISKYPEIAGYIKDVTMSYADLIDMVKELNRISTGEQAEKAAKDAEAKLEGRKATIKEYGNQLTEEGFLALTQNPNFRAFGNINTSRYLTEGILINNKGEYDIGETFIDSASARQAALAIADVTESILEEVSKKGSLELEKTIGELKITAQKIGDQAINSIVNTQIDIYRSQLTAQSEMVKKTLTDQSREVELTMDSYKDFRKVINETEGAITEYSKTQKELGIQNTETLVKQYNALKAFKEGMAPLIDLTTGKPKDYAKYSDDEAARLLGKTTEEFSKTYNAYLEERKRTDGENQKSEEEYRREYLENNITRNEKLNEISIYTSQILQLLPGAVAAQLGGGRSASLVMDKIDKDLKTKGRWKGKTRTASEAELKSDLNAYTNAFIRDIRPNNPQSKTFEGNLDIYDSKGNIKSREAFMNEAAGIISDTYGASGTLANDLKAKASLVYQEVVNKIGEIPKAIDKPFGPKFDAAAEKLNKFFKDLEADINKTETAYLNAEKALDSVLAKQKGRVTAAGLAFGKNSGIVEYEQNLLEDLEESQMSARLANMVEKRRGLGQAYESLIGSADYKSVTERYQKAYDQYNNALARGSYKEADAARRIMNTLGSANKKYTEEEKKLTQEITKLDKDIIELDYTLGEANTYRNMGLGSQLSLGWGAASSRYIKGVENSGLMTLGGSMEYLSTQAIDAFDSSMTNMFQNIASGSQKAGDAFKDFGRKVLETIRDIAIQMAVKQGISMLLSAFMGGGNDITESGGGSSSFATYSINNAVGGLVRGPIKNRDSVPTMLMPGEFVMKKSAVDTIGRDYLENLNANASATMEAAGQSISDSKSANPSESTGAGGVVNVYVVGQEQQQNMTPNDVIVTISQDMLTGGQTKRLVKSIAMGSI